MVQVVKDARNIFWVVVRGEISVVVVWFQEIMILRVREAVVFFETVWAIVLGSRGLL